MPASVAPFLMFEGKAEEAMNLYVSVIPDSRVIDVNRYGPGGPGPDGSIMMARFSVGGLEVLCSDSYVKHAFTFTPSTSFFIQCDDVAEFERLFSALSADGQVLMPPDNYGFSKRFAWCNDRFGVSWQINVP